jgi:hypothetical protein
MTLDSCQKEEGSLREFIKKDVWKSFCARFLGQMNPQTWFIFENFLAILAHFICWSEREGILY